ncbi:MAG: lipoprotein [Pseudoxanthomonas sp.]
MDKSLRIALAAPILIALAGCGAKGPLILPEKAIPIEAPADEPTDNTPQIDGAVTTPADQEAEDAVEDPAPPAAND